MTIISFSPALANCFGTVINTRAPDGQGGMKRSSRWIVGEVHRPNGQRQRQRLSLFILRRILTHLRRCKADRQAYSTTKQALNLLEACHVCMVTTYEAVGTFLAIRAFALCLLRCLVAMHTRQKAFTRWNQGGKVRASWKRGGLRERTARTTIAE